MDTRLGKGAIHSWAAKKRPFSFIACALWKPCDYRWTGLSASGFHFTYSHKERMSKIFTNMELGVYSENSLKSTDNKRLELDLRRPIKICMWNEVRCHDAVPLTDRRVSLSKVSEQCTASHHEPRYLIYS